MASSSAGKCTTIHHPFIPTLQPVPEKVYSEFSGLFHPEIQKWRNSVFQIHQESKNPRDDLEKSIDKVGKLVKTMLQKAQSPHYSNYPALLRAVCHLTLGSVVDIRKKIFEVPELRILATILEHQEITPEDIYLMIDASFRALNNSTLSATSQLVINEAYRNVPSHPTRHEPPSIGGETVTRNAPVDFFRAADFIEGRGGCDILVVDKSRNTALALPLDSTTSKEAVRDLANKSHNIALKIFSLPATLQVTLKPTQTIFPFGPLKNGYLTMDARQSASFTLQTIHFDPLQEEEEARKVYGLEGYSTKFKPLAPEELLKTLDQTKMSQVQRTKIQEMYFSCISEHEAYLHGSI